MEKPFGRVLVLIPIFAIIVLLAIAAPVAAECTGGDFGTAGNDTVTCDSAHQPDQDVGGDMGNDTITVGAGVSAPYVTGDGNDSNNDNTFDQPVGDGGDDTIVLNGNAGLVSGDYSFGDGGDDTIIINGTADNVQGDMALGGFAVTGGNDTIIVNGTVAGQVTGDTVSVGDGGDDTIIINGTAGGVSGDDVSENGGDDTIIINGYVQYVAGDQTSTTWSHGGDDTIIVNGTVSGDLYGDNGPGSGGNDTIIISGVVGGHVYGDSGYVTPGGDDTVILQNGAVVDGFIDGDAGHDTIIFSFTTTDPAAFLDWMQQLANSMPDGGTVTINGHTYTWQNFEELLNMIRFISTTDGRINCDYSSGAVYTNAGGIFVYGVDADKRGYLTTYITEAQIADSPALPEDDFQLAGSDDGRFAIYRLPSGDFRADIVTPEGKLETTTFDALQPSRVTCENN